MTISGVIHGIDIPKRLFTIKVKKRLHYFYLQNNLLKKFKKYLYKGRFVQFEYDEEAKINQGVKSYRVEYFIKIIKQMYRRQETYYDIDVIRKGIVDLVNGFENIMFLDLEMSMHDFCVSPNFESEIIQAGYIICDKNGKDLLKESFYVKPTIFPKITKRTKKFLKIDDEDIDNGISYREFYSKFEGSLEKYNPTILVWGKNDIIILRSSYRLNEVPSLDKYSFINLLQIQKNYFNLKNDLGLFNALQVYGGEEFLQIHDALADALVTKEVFFAFKNIINNCPDFVFPSL